MCAAQAYSLIWLSALSACAVLVVGVKLQSIVICLAQDAYRLYGNRSGGWAGWGVRLVPSGCAGRTTPHSARVDWPPGRARDLGLRGCQAPATTLAGILPSRAFRRASLLPAAARIKEPSMLEHLKMHLRRMSPFPGTRLPRVAADGEASQRVATSCYSEPAADGVRRAALMAAQSAPLPAAEVQLGSGSGEEQAGHGTRPAPYEESAQQNGALAGRAADGASQQDSAYEPGSEALAGRTGGSAGEAKGQPGPSPQQQQAVDVEAQQSVRLEGDAGGSSSLAGSSVFRRCCPWLLACTPRRSRQQQWAAAGTLRRSQSFADS